MYSIVINGIDRTNDVISNTLVITDQLNDQVNTCDFTIVDHSGNGLPTEDQEIVITLADGTKLFGGYINAITTSTKDYGVPGRQVKCVDYTKILDRLLAHVSYESQTDKEVIEDLVDRYAPTSGITTTNVIEGVTLSQIVFNYVQISQAIRKVADLTGRHWYIDYDKDIHYLTLEDDLAPFDIDSTSANFEGLQLKKDTSQIKNRIYVRGGTKLSDFVTYETVGDGATRHFVIPDKAHDVSLTLNGVDQTVGIKNINTSGFDYYLNFEEKYIEQDEGATLLTSSDTLILTYKYDIPILVAQQDEASISEHGAYEFAIFDRTITTTDAARDRAIAELTDYADAQVDGSFQTWTAGFRSGQTININRSDYGINDNYIVQKVQASSIGGGNFKYTISLTSAKKYGIIKFLITLLENNRNLIQLDANEVVDELFLVTDSILSDSLVDSLQLQVGAKPFKYGSAKYGLAEFN